MQRPVRIALVLLAIVALILWRRVGCQETVRTRPPSPVARKAAPQAAPAPPNSMNERSFIHSTARNGVAASPAETAPGAAGEPARPEPPHRLRFHVVAEDTGAPVAGAELRTLLGGDAQLPAATTNGDGVAEVGIFDLAMYYVRVEHPGFAGLGYGDIRVARDQFVPIAVDARTVEQGIELRMRRGATVRGEVRDPAGAPLEAFIELLCDGSEDEHRTAAGGRYEFAGLEPGSYAVRVSASPYLTEGRDVRVLPRAVVEVPPITLRTGVALSGYVRDEDGKPVTTATVGARPPLNLRVAALQEDGRFELEGLPPGRTVVRASAMGYFSLEREVDVGAESMVSFTLRRGGTLDIILVPEADGYVAASVCRAGSLDPIAQDTRERAFRFEFLPDEPLDIVFGSPDCPRARLDGVRARPKPYEVTLLATVEVSGRVAVAPGDPPAWLERAIFRTEGGGSSEVGPLADGDPYRIDVPVTATRIEMIFHGYEPVVLDGLRLRSGARIERDIVLARGATLRGRVVDRDGHGIGEAEVEVRIPGLAIAPAGRTEVDGTFAIEGIPVAAVRIALKHPHFRSSETDARTDHDALVTLDPFE
jgi:hypothetical protein